MWETILLLAVGLAFGLIWDLLIYSLWQLRRELPDGEDEASPEKDKN